MVGWGGALFVVQTAFALGTMGMTVWVLLLFLFGLFATFPLHANTRGPALVVTAFGLSFALFVEGIAFMVEAVDVAVSKRLLVGGALGLPLAALVVRRWSSDARDAWFARHARRVVPLALLAGLPLFVAGAYGSFSTDPGPYERALAALGRAPFDVYEGVAFDRHEQDRQRWWAFQFASPRIEPAIVAEIERDCGRFAAGDPSRACACSSSLLSAHFRRIERRRSAFRVAAVASAVPLAVALLFAWRGRRPRSPAS